MTFKCRYTPCPHVIIIIVILGLCYHFSPFYGGTPPWIASTDVCLGPILSRWFPGADWGHLSILFSVFLVVLAICVEPRMLLWWSTCCLEVWLHDLPIGVSTVWCGLLMSVTPVCCRIQGLCLWSRRVMPSIILFIFLCATASASIWAVVKAQVSLPYVITGARTHWTLFLDLHACFAASHDVVYLAEGSPSQSDTSLDLWH